LRVSQPPHVDGVNHRTVHARGIERVKLVGHDWGGWDERPELVGERARDFFA
jgi:hypothetical protein